MSREQLRELERLRQLWLADPTPNMSAYIMALEAALWRQVPHPDYLDRYSWRLFGWEIAVMGDEQPDDERGGA